MADAGTGTEPVIDGRRARLVISASTLGTIFEWYDFFVYGTLAAIIGREFFPAESETAQFLAALASFGVGFGVRPVGAVLFGYLGDRLGRKYTFLVTIVLMGLATAAVGLVPSYSRIGVAAPILLVLLRVLQGLALGGEYGGAAIYVAEHAPPGRRGFYTSFIQAGVIGGFLFSLAVVLSAEAFVSEAAWNDWGWRIPFLFSLVLLAISLYMRLKLKESPVFRAMRDAGEVARNPLRQSFASWANIRLVLVALLGIAAGVTVIWYTVQFQATYFLQNGLRIGDTQARIVVGFGAVVSVGWFILFGWLSDRIGRKRLVVGGYALTLLLLFPVFHFMGAIANPPLAAAMERAPVVVHGHDCRFDPFASRQETSCGQVLDMLVRTGIGYTKVEAPAGRQASVTIGGVAVGRLDRTDIDVALRDAGYPLDKITPSLWVLVQLVLAVVVLGALAGMTFGPTAALLVELFPPQIRYTSLSIPYHIGTGYFGGFLPFVSQLIVVRTGDPYAGLWYTFAIVAMALVVTAFGLPETLRPADRRRG